MQRKSKPYWQALSLRFAARVIAATIMWAVAGTASPVVAQNHAPTILLSSNPNPSVVGQSVLVTATVSDSDGTAGNVVTFDFNNNGIDDAIVAVDGSGQASVTTTFTGPGPYTIKATTRDPSGATATTTRTQNISVQSLKATETFLRPSVNPSGYHDSLTFTATVAGYGAVPTGTVQFMDGGGSLGSPVTLNTLGVGFPLAAGVTGQHSCAVNAVGGVKCWGNNRYGQLGSTSNTGTDISNPTPIDTGLAAIVGIAAGAFHTCALTVAGGVKCWGNNQFGQLGSSTNSGTLTANPTPMDTGLSGIVAIAAGNRHTCALTMAGGVKCWGYNQYGQLGTSTNSGTGLANATPIDTGLSGIVGIAAGDGHTCAVTNVGGVKCWGANLYGELGSTSNIGTITPNPTPIDTGLSSI